MATIQAGIARRGTADRATPARRARAAHERYLNRELSWIAFNERVLELAEDASMPLHDWTDRPGWDGLHHLWITELLRWLSGSFRNSL